MKVSMNRDWMRAALMCTLVTAGYAVSLHAQTAVAAGDASVNASLVRKGNEKFKVISFQNSLTTDFATMDRETTPMMLKGRAALRIVRHYTGPFGKNVDTTFVDAKSLAPISMRSHSDYGDVALNYSGRNITGEQRTKEGATPVKVTLEQPAFDANMLEEVIAALPLKTGYAARLPFYAGDNSDELNWVTLSVSGDTVVAGVPAWHVTATDRNGTIHYAIAKVTRANLETRYKMFDRELTMKSVVVKASPAKPVKR